MGHLAATFFDAPFRDVHGHIGRRIAALCRELGYIEDGKQEYDDLFGGRNKCPIWQRVNADHPLYVKIINGLAPGAPALSVQDAMARWGYDASDTRNVLNWMAEVQQPPTMSKCYQRI